VLKGHDDTPSRRPNRLGRIWSSYLLLISTVILLPLSAILEFAFHSWATDEEFVFAVAET
jgi:hypothetical protein